MLDSSDHSDGIAGLKGSTAMSQAVITGGAIAGVAVTFTKRHPLDSSLPLIDFQLALVLTPVLLFGTSIGGRS